MSIYPVNGASSGTDDSTLAKAVTTEREAYKRIQAAGTQVKQAQQDADLSLRQIQDSYEKQTGAQASRQELALESQQSKGYEQIRDLQKAQQAELRKIRQEGEKETSTLSEHFRNTLSNSTLQGQGHLQELQSQNHQKTESERQSGDAQISELKADQLHRIDLLHQGSESQLNQLNESRNREYQKMKDASETATERAREQFEGDYKKTLTQNTQILDQMANKASQKIREIRNDTTDKLSAYASRQKDPFYRLMAVNARLHDDDDGYTLTARIPQHEQNHVSASVKGNTLQLTGYRRNEENLEIDPGHVRGSASFQSFHESFPLSWPVDSDRLTRESEGDLVIIRVPKKNEFAFQPPPTQKPEKVRVERPHFPENLPQTPSKLQEEKGQQRGYTAGTGPALRNPGSGTLS